MSFNNSSRLARKLDVKDAVILGLTSMIGSGIFAAVGPATMAAGSGVLFGVLIAALVAYMNATSMAQLASLYPESGGTYIYGRKQLGDFWGFLAGWGFVIGKMASCTAMALTFGFYAAPEYARPLAVGAVLILTAVNYFGIKKTAFVTKGILTVVIFSLVGVLVATFGGGQTEFSRLTSGLGDEGPFGVLQAAGLMFFAFAGYARVATLGEEVIEPKRTIPRSILMALGMTVFLYVLVIGSVLLVTDVDEIARSKAPLQFVVESGRFSFLSPLVKIGACFGSLGVLLSLLAGISRTTFAMAANRDLPHVLSRVHPVHKVPHVAEVMVGLIVALMVAFADLRLAIGFSSFAILTYYSIANLSAWRLKREQRLWPRWFSTLGFISCVLIAASLPLSSVLGGLTLFLLGAGYYRLNR